MLEVHRSSLAYLSEVTTLTQRVRQAHPTSGQFEAADFQWWWRKPRSTDDFPQLFWFDDTGPEAAVIATDWDGTLGLDPILMPGSEPEWVAHVVERGLRHADEGGFGAIEVTIDRADQVMADLLAGEGFAVTKDETVESWLDADSRPAISALRSGYRLASRLDTTPAQHHMTARNGPVVAERLGQTSLYRPDLDLVVFDDDDRVAAYGLFWFDPVTNTGLVEPMRTEDEHQRRGLARHVLTTGVDLLARAGARRIKICFEPDNEAARALYLAVGFQPVKECVVMSRVGKR